MTYYLYFCHVKRRNGLIILICMVMGGLFAYYRRPIIVEGLTKQTIYIGSLNAFHIQDREAYPTAMLIDDDSEYGVYAIRKICDELGIKATFAVIPSRLDSAICNSLKRWQQEGFGIALHGYNHDRWKGWTTEDIIDDITRSEELLAKVGFRKDFEYVVPPHACNTSAIRKAIRQKGYKMVTGANIINPDTTVFQYGRMSFNKDMSPQEMRRIRELLIKAYRKKSFIIFGTHSSLKGAFSEEKTKAVLQMAKDIGFKFI